MKKLILKVGKVKKSVYALTGSMLATMTSYAQAGCASLSSIAEGKTRDIKAFKKAVDSWKKQQLTR